jgi:hypothetical protein
MARQGGLSGISDLSTTAKMLHWLPGSATSWGTSSSRSDHGCAGPWIRTPENFPSTLLVHNPLAPVQTGQNLEEVFLFQRV